MLLTDPVSAEDGQIYEKEAIERWFGEEEMRTSPTTGLEISTTTHSVLSIKNMVDDLIEYNPEYKEDRYIPDRSYTTNKKRIMKFMEYKRFDKLLLYKNFLIMDTLLDYVDNTSIIEYLCKRCSNNNVIKYVLDNCIDIECNDPLSGMYPIHIICRYGSPDIIKYIVEKGVNLNCFTNTYKYPPMYYICRNHKYDMVKYFIDKGVNLDTLDYGNRTNLHTACKYNTYDVIKCLVDANANFMIKTKNGHLAVNVCLLFQNKLTILYMLSKYYNYMMTHDYKVQTGTVSVNLRIEGTREYPTNRLLHIENTNYIIDDDLDDDDDDDDGIFYYNNNNNNNNNNDNFMNTTDSLIWLSQNKKINHKDVMDILVVLIMMTKKEKDRTITQDDINNILNLSDKTFDITIR